MVSVRDARSAFRTRGEREEVCGPVAGVPVAGGGGGDPSSIGRPAQIGNTSITLGRGVTGVRLPLLAGISQIGSGAARPAEMLDGARRHGDASRASLREPRQLPERVSAPDSRMSAS